MDIFEYVSDNKGKCLSGTFLLGSLIFGGCYGLNHNEYAKGSKAGMINEFSEKGYVFKTYEGQMALEGMTSKNGVSGANLWEFSLNPDDPNSKKLEEKIKKYMDSGTKVKIDYRQMWTVWKPSGSTRYFVSDVKPIEDSKKD